MATYTNSKLVSYTRLSPNHSGQRTQNIYMIAPHCVVGQASVETLGNIFAPRSRQASCNYGIGADGRVGMYCEEKNRSWCTSSNWVDQRAVTIECASDAKAPYAFNNTVYNKLVDLCVDICKRNGKNKILWLGSRAKTEAYKPKSNEMLFTVHRWYANKACVPTSSEVLTKDGWVRIGDIEIGDEIACADLDNLNITFEEVYDKVPIRQQDTYTNNGLTATMDHRMVYHNQHNDILKIEDYKHLLNSGNNIYIPLAGHANFEGMDVTDDMLRLLVAMQADGHYMYEKKASGEKSYYGVEFHLKKDRKIERIKELLLSCNLDWNENHKSDGSVSIRVYNHGDINIVTDIFEQYLSDKNFTWEWINLSPHQAEVFLDEILLWDGCVAANLYTSREKINLDVVSAIASLNGVGGRINGSNIQFRESPYMTLSKENTKRNNRQHGGPSTEVTCVSVKTGIFLMRQNGKTFIVGNCPGDWLMARMDDLTKRVNAKLGTSTAPAVSQSTTTAAQNKSFPSTPFLVQVLVSDLNIRKGAGTNYASVGHTGKGEFTITKVSNGWGYLKSGAGWIYLGNASYVKVGKTVASSTSGYSPSKVADAKGKNSAYNGKYITTADLNLRYAPNGAIITVMPKGTTVYNYGWYTQDGSTTWLSVQATVKGQSYTGYCGKGYLKKI